MMVWMKRLAERLVGMRVITMMSSIKNGDMPRWLDLGWKITVAFVGGAFVVGIYFTQISTAQVTEKAVNDKRFEMLQRDISGIARDITSTSSKIDAISQRQSMISSKLDVVANDVDWLKKSRTANLPRQEQAVFPDKKE